MHSLQAHCCITDFDAVHSVQIRSCHRCMLSRREHLAAAQQRAVADQEEAVTRFKSWASLYVHGAEHMNVCSGTQIRQLLFAGAPNNKAPDDATKRLELTRVFKVRQPQARCSVQDHVGRSSSPGLGATSASHPHSLTRCQSCNT